LLRAGLLQPQDLLTVEGAEGKRQTASLTPDGRISVAGQVFDAVSPAALRALELAGKPRKAVNGWATFRAMRAGNYLGTLLEIRGQYEDQEQTGSPAGAAPEPGAVGPEGTETAVQAAIDQMKPLLGLLPELTVNASKTSASLYAGKLVVGYAHPRKKGLPRLMVCVGDAQPEGTTPHPGYAAWAFLEDWHANVQRSVTVLKEAPRRRAEELAAGWDAYRRREHPTDSAGPVAAD
jgi:hypothetical protein